MGVISSPAPYYSYVNLAYSDEWHMAAVTSITTGISMLIGWNRPHLVLKAGAKV
jgi:hypothetical protein